MCWGWGTVLAQSCGDTRSHPHPFGITSVLSGQDGQGRPHAGSSAAVDTGQAGAELVPCTPSQLRPGGKGPSKVPTESGASLEQQGCWSAEERPKELRNALNSRKFPTVSRTQSRAVPSGNRLGNKQYTDISVALENIINHELLLGSGHCSERVQNPCFEELSLDLMKNQPVGSHPVQQGAEKGLPGECVNSQVGHSFPLNKTMSLFLHC